MRRLLLLCVLLLSLFLSGCSSKEAKLKPIQKSYFYFTGKASGVEICIDNGTKFGIVASKKSVYSIDAGAHVMEIYRKNQMILKYDFIFDEGKVKEIELR